MPKMGQVIVTTRSLIWILLTILSTLIVFSALFTPKWLIGPQTMIYGPNGTVTSFFPHSVGIFNRCTRLNGVKHCAVFALDGLATDSNVFPTFWKVSLVSYVLGLTIMAFTMLASLISCCIQSIYKKSIFTVTGTVQGVAGLFYIIGIIMYASGMGSARVVRLCGPESQAFYWGDCTLGTSMYLAIFGTIVTWLTAGLSVSAEKSTSSDKVQRRVEEKGEAVIFLV